MVKQDGMESKNVIFNGTEGVLNMESSVSWRSWKYTVQK